MNIAIKKMLIKIPGVLVIYLRLRVIVFHLRNFIVWGPLKYFKVKKEYRLEMEIIRREIQQYANKDYFDFAGAKLPVNIEITPDAYFNVIRPHVLGIVYDACSINAFFSEIKSMFTRIVFWGGTFRSDRVSCTEVFTFAAHGFTYFFEEVNIQKGEVVFDVGAAPGEFASVAIAKGASVVYAFEPDRGGFLRLNEVSQLNDCRILSQPLRVCALSDFNNDCTSLDDFVVQKGLEKVDFIKMDIEGYEIGAIQGAEMILSRFGPKLSICSYHAANDYEEMRKLINFYNPQYKFINGDGILYAYIG